MATEFKSEAQREKWKVLLQEGRVTPEQFAEREAHTPAWLPSRAAPRRRTVGPSRSFDAAPIGKTRY